MGFLDVYPIINIRRNHGFEHATVHVLSEKYRNLSIVGRSDLGGFTLYGNVDTNVVIEASHEALGRLQAGQKDLAVHPRCGTVLATTGLLTGLMAFLAVSLGGPPRQRFRWVAFPETILATTLAAILAQPLGMFFQANYTVSGQPGNLEIKDITRLDNKHMTVHRINTQQ